jgi:hypothetical protein
MVRAISEPDGSASRMRRTLPNKALQRTALRAAAERRDVGQRRMIPSRMSAVAAAVFMSTPACAHQAATSPAPLACSEEKVALRVARDDARETARLEGTPVTIDESRTISDDARAAWRFWLLVPEATARGRAFIYVRKSDCSAQWEPFLYEM